MKRYSLSTKLQKWSAIAIDVFFVLFYIQILIISDPSDWMIYIFFVLSIFLCVFYTLIIFTSSLTIDTVNKLIYYRIIQRTIYDLNEIQTVKWESREQVRGEKQVIALYNAHGFMVAEINPFLTKRTLPILADIFTEIEKLVVLKPEIGS